MVVGSLSGMVGWWSSGGGLAVVVVWVGLSDGGWWVGFEWLNWVRGCGGGDCEIVVVVVHGFGLGGGLRGRGEGEGLAYG